MIGFGWRRKQSEPVDARGHIIMDYSIYDAMEAEIQQGCVCKLEKISLQDFDVSYWSENEEQGNSDRIRIFRK